MGLFSRKGNTLIFQENQETVWLQPWGVNGLRLRANLAGLPLDLPQALLDLPGDFASDVRIEITEARKPASGTAAFRRPFPATAGCPSGMPPPGRYCWKSGKEKCSPPLRPIAISNIGTEGLHKIEAWFKAQEGERFYGLGQHQHGLLDQKGCVIELHQRNTEVTIPFLVSNRKYGFLWNNPSIGRVELGRNATRWVAEGSRQLDYYVTCGDTYAEILEQYAAVTGKPPAFPAWASGFLAKPVAV